MEINPDEIYTVAVSLEGGSTIYAVAGEAEEKKINFTTAEHRGRDKIISLMQIRNESADA